MVGTKIYTSTEAHFMFDIAKGLFCKLQRPSIEDADVLLKWVQDPFLQEKIFGIEPEYQQAQKLVQKWIEENTELFGADNLILIARHIKNDIPIGLVMLKNIDWKNRNLDIHYLIADKDRREGPYGPEMVLTALVHIFHTLNFDKVYGYVYNNNLSSLNMANFAAKEEGILKNYSFVDNEWLDYHLFSITQQDFKSFLEKNKSTFLRHHFKKGLIH